MRDRKPHSQPSMAVGADLSASERMNAALVQFARLLGRQAARDALRAGSTGRTPSHPDPEPLDHDD